MFFQFDFCSRAVKRFAFLFFVFFLSFGVIQAVAGDHQGAQVFLNTIKYIHGFQGNGSLGVGAVYDPGNAASKKEAENFYNDIKKGKAGSYKLKPRMITINDLKNAKNITFLYVPNGMRVHHKSLRKIVQKKRLFAISSNISCVRDELCVLAMKQGSGVDIYLNEAVLRDLGFRLDSVFKFMVKRI